MLDGDPHMERGSALKKITAREALASREQVCYF